MVHIGNTPASNFASVTKDTFSGDGSTTAFTLSKAATTNGVAVFVENVRQEPTTAYAVSGTTLTFTAAPVSASGNNIYVLHHNSPASTATHPATQALTATSGTFTGAFTSVGNVTLSGNLLTGVNKNIDVRDADGHVSGRLRNVSGSNNALTIEADPDNSASGSYVSFKVDTSEKMKVDDTGDVTISDGDLVIGTSGHGIDFSATANTSTSGASMSSELFDYYEEGTWTPAGYGGTTAGSFSATTVAGVYTRIGRIVYCEVRISSGSLSGAAGTFQVSGLPFTIGGTQYGCSGSFAFNTIDFDPSTIPVIQLGSSTNFYFLVSQDDTGWSTLTVSNFDSTFTLIGTFIYQTG